MQVEKGRNSQTVKEGKSKRGYEALDIEEDVSKSKYIVHYLKEKVHNLFNWIMIMYIFFFLDIFPIFS